MATSTVNGQSALRLVLLLLVTALVCPMERSHVWAAQHERADVAIRRLLSADESERMAAKLELLEIGRPAIPPMLSALKSVLDSPKSPYTVSDNDPVAIAPPLASTDEDNLSGRLEADICQLLGRLRAVEAVPLLIEMMQSRDSFTGLASMVTEMQAIAEIGPPAVPLLIEAIEDAPNRAARIGFGDPQPSEEERIKFIQGEVAKIRARAARVLGEIGDKRALQTLERLLLEPPNEFDFWRPDVPYIEEAIKQIRKREDRKP